MHVLSIVISVCGRVNVHVLDTFVCVDKWICNCFALLTVYGQVNVHVPDTVFTMWTSRYARALYYFLSVAVGSCPRGGDVINMPTCTCVRVRIIYIYLAFSPLLFCSWCKFSLHGDFNYILL